MAEYIEKEALRNALYDADAITISGISIINRFPAVDVLPMKWIPVTERLPELFKYVLVYRPDGAMQIIVDAFTGKWFRSNDLLVTHWMPLPEPPKEAL